MPSLLPSPRCALTAPFHPYRAPCEALGGLLSVALSVGSRPPGVTWHPIRRSPDFPPSSCENSDCLAGSPVELYHAPESLFGLMQHRICLAARSPCQLRSNGRCPPGRQLLCQQL